MSAIAWGPTEVHHAPVPSRPRLVVIEGGAGLDEADDGLRLTRRGRLVLLLVAALAVAAFLALTGVRGADATEPGRTVTVHAGQTLSEIAAAELPGRPLDEAIVAIQLANDMSTAQVSAGQELVLPRS